MLIVSPHQPPPGEAVNGAVSCLSDIDLLEFAMNRLTIILILSCACLCFSKEHFIPKFRLDIGAEGAYALSWEYWSEFDSTSRAGPFSKGSLIPSLDMGLEINPRFSLFLRYSHFMMWSNRSYERFQQLSYVAVASMVAPSQKFSNLYLSYSLGILYWPNNTESFQSGFGTTVAFGYRVNNYFRIQIDMDYLGHSTGSSINRVTIDQNDSTNTIRNLGEADFGTNWFEIMIGLSAILDIF